MCGLKQQPTCASLCDGDPIIFACLKQVLHFLQPRLATLTSLAGFCIFQPAPSRLQHFSARPPAWFSGRLKSPDFRQAGSLAARQAQPSFSLLRLCSPPGVSVLFFNTYLLMVWNLGAPFGAPKVARAVRDCRGACGDCVAPEASTGAKN